MWFEVLPSAAIITVVLAVPGYALWGLNKALVGNSFRRNTDQRWNRMMYTHDCVKDRNGNPYKVHGLEAIPDK